MKNNNQIKLASQQEIAKMSNTNKKFYFDTGVWNNIIEFVDPRPPKQAVFTNGVHCAKHHSNTFDKKITVVGRTKCFIKVKEEKITFNTGSTFSKSFVEYRKKINMKDGIETIKIGTVASIITITAHDKRAYNYANKEEMIKAEMCIHSGDEAEHSESDIESESDSEGFRVAMGIFRTGYDAGLSAEDALVAAGFTWDADDAPRVV